MSFSGAGSGTIADPYIITTVEQLQEMQNDLAAHYALAQDIDASETVNWNNGAGFEPIGAYGEAFVGSFDGRGYKITGLYINRGSTDHVGLFGYADGATIQNVDLVDGTIVGGNYTGGVVGRLSYGSVTHQCYNTGSVTGRGNTGGVAGYLWESYVTQCYNTGSVTGGQYYTGGVVGGAVSLASIAECYNTGSVTGQDRTGGVVGRLINSSLRRCYNTGNVTGRNETGGVIGYRSADINTSTSSCYWNTETSGVSRGVGVGPSSEVFGKTTAEMKRQDTFVGWDFDEVWQIQGDSYPRLRFFLDDKEDDIVFYHDGDQFAAATIHYHNGQGWQRAKLSVRDEETWK